ncbi:Serine protease inhibitor SERPIN family protein, partial [Prunus dulcis]
NGEVRHFERYAQVRVYKAKLFNGLSQGDHAWHDDVLEVSGRWEGDVSDGPLVPITYCDASNWSLDWTWLRSSCFEHPLRFREWRWLLSEYREEDGGLPLLRMSKGGSRTVLTLMICLAKEECYAESFSKRKAAAKSSRGEATSSHAKDGSPLRKTSRLSSTENTQVVSAPSSSARVKHLVGADSTKVGGMRGTRGVLLEPPADMLENHDMLREAARARP